MADIATEAGVGLDDANAMFPDEHAVLMGVIEVAYLRLFDLSTRTAGAVANADPVEQMRAMGEAYLDWAFENPALFLVASDRTHLDFVNDPTLRRYIQAMRQLTESMLQRALDAGRFPGNEDINILLLGARTYVYGMARLNADGHFPEWMPDIPDRLELCKRTLRDYLRRVV
ncbi:TetR/AcrR family transcriptional regulator [Paracoccus sp. (in: a-proteobacteria)]|uniref:TetR/AcrR family transcriptional regulator n=1 Tax=Paracoccus sp. TaxID=267 RepID=UPI0026DF7D4C|nr:TetR-like C-terminal domain-containing protein [Paracoccus sp. (in: a-proteobacteria)]MDO5647395.1 TetR-like C-terminal domain-containing protein [Paracoccus sp. (in: a-proteobacteria)]